MTEAEVQSKILKKLKEDGAYTVKVIAASKRGVPDILACYKGYFIAVEVKAVSSYKVTKLQDLNISRIRAAGGIAICAIGYEDFIALWDLIKSNINQD